MTWRIQHHDSTHHSLQQAKSLLSAATDDSAHSHARQGQECSWLRRLGLLVSTLVLVTVIGLLTCTLLAIYWAAPSLEKFHMRSNVLYDKDGAIVYEMMTPDDYHRILTLPDHVDPLYLKMLIASEDERFYKHFGVDILSIMRALVSNLISGKRVSGASTLAMQVCRLLEPKERNLISKFKEALGAVYLTLKYGRDQVLTMYLTLAPFGGNIEGVNAAAYSYFNHSPAQLTPAEAALLVALPRSPEKIRPDRHHNAAIYYRNEVLTKAVTDGVIKQDILDTATREGVPQFTYDLPRTAFHLGQSIYAGKLHPLLTDLLINEQAFMTPMDLHCPAFGYFSAQPTTTVTAREKETESATVGAHTASAQYSPALLAVDSAQTKSKVPLNQTLDSKAFSNLAAPQTTLQSLQDMPLRLRLRFDLQGRRLPTEVYTTLDGQVQQTLLEVLDGYQNSSLKFFPKESLGLIAVDNQSFEVIGYVSSAKSYVDVIQAQRSPGSALKPFAYAMAFEQGLVHPNSVLLDLGKIYRTYQPRNYDRMFFGEITAAQALQGSLNLPALEIMRAVGPVNFVDRLNAYPNTITNRYLFQPQLERIQANSTQIYAQTGTTEQLGQAQHAAIKSLPPVLAPEDRQDSIGQELHSTRTDLSEHFNNTASAAVQQAQSFNPHDYIRGRIKLMPHTLPHIGIILGACSISLYDLTQLYASLAHDGQIMPLNIIKAQQCIDSTDSKNSQNSKDNDIATINLALSTKEESTQHTDTKAVNSQARGNRQGRLNHWSTFLEPDTARITFNILEGLPAPAGFNYDHDLKISYKTGTSFKYRDTIAIGTRGAITVGVWQGQVDGNPSRLALSAYEKTAPILFRVLTLLPEKKVFKTILPQSGLLSRKPPQALAQLEIKTLGLTGLRRSNELEQQSSFTQVLPLEIVYPSDGMRIQASASGRILLQIQGGQPPYYLLIDEQPQQELSYFEPSHNGIYTITALDSTGQSKVVQIWVEGVIKEDNTTEENADSDVNDE